MSNILKELQEIRAAIAVDRLKAEEALENLAKQEQQKVNEALGSVGEIELVSALAEATEQKLQEIIEMFSFVPPDVAFKVLQSNSHFKPLFRLLRVNMPASQIKSRSGKVARSSIPYDEICNYIKEAGASGRTTKDIKNKFFPPRNTSQEEQNKSSSRTSQACAKLVNEGEIKKDEKTKAWIAL